VDIKNETRRINTTSEEAGDNKGLIYTLQTICLYLDLYLFMDTHSDTAVPIGLTRRKNGTQAEACVEVV